MTGSPSDLGIPTKIEPKPDSRSKKEDRDLSSSRADDGREKRQIRRWFFNAVIVHHYILYLIIFLSGFSSDKYDWQFSLDP